MSSGTKRKSDVGAGSSSKKPRTSNAHASAIGLVTSILENPDNFPIPDDDDTIRQNLVQLAQYAQFLENQVAAGSGGAGSAAVAAKTPEQLQEAAEKLRRAAVAGIKKQMSWKPSCGTGSAKFSYDGVCADPLVFGALMGLNGPPAWKQKKISIADFENLLGHIEGSVRYATLYITSQEISVRWNDGEFKFGGTYGKI